MRGPTEDGEHEEEDPEAIEYHHHEAQLVEGHRGDCVQDVADGARGVHGDLAGGSLRTSTRTVENRHPLDLASG